MQPCTAPYRICRHTTVSLIQSLISVCACGLPATAAVALVGAPDPWSCRLLKCACLAMASEPVCPCYKQDGKKFGPMGVGWVVARFLPRDVGSRADAPRSAAARQRRC